MSRIKIFFDSSALIAGVLSVTGAARALLVLSETGDIDLIVSEQVIAETERSLAKKAPQALPGFRQTIRESGLKIVKAPSFEEVQASLYMISDPTDAPILVAAMKQRVDILVTHNQKHFLYDPHVAEKSGLRIGTPGDALAWLRENMG